MGKIHFQFRVYKTIWSKTAFNQLLSKQMKADRLIHNATEYL